jgi:hypothetical protein
MYNDYELDGTGIRFLQRRRATAKEWVEGLVGMAAIVGFMFLLLWLARSR